MKWKVAIGAAVIFAAIAFPALSQVQPGNGSISDPLNSAYKVSVTPYGELSVFTEPANFFQDTFDSGSRDTNNWAAPTAAGGGVLAIWSSGNLQIASGTTAAGYSYATTVPTFRPTQPGYLRFGFAINLPASLPTNTYAAWGNFTPTATPSNPPTAGSTTGPIQEGCGFEALPGNKLYIACYAGNVRTQIADISASWPTDGKTHLWTEDFRGDLMAWYLGSSTAGITDPMTRTTLATQQNGVNGPNINTQPITILTIGGAGTPSSSLVTNVAAIWVGVTNNTQRICDGTYAFRCATVTAGGGLSTVPAPSPASGGTGTATAATITSTSTQILAAGSRRLLTIKNESASASIACNLGGTAVLNTAGDYTIPPLSLLDLSGYPAPADAVNCISSVASSPATIRTF